MARRERRPRPAGSGNLGTCTGAGRKPPPGQARSGAAPLEGRLSRELPRQSLRPLAPGRAGRLLPHAPSLPSAPPLPAPRRPAPPRRCDVASRVNQASGFTSGTSFSSAWNSLPCHSAGPVLFLLQVPAQVTSLEKAPAQHALCPMWWPLTTCGRLLLELNKMSNSGHRCTDHISSVQQLPGARGYQRDRTGISITPQS